ncbi:MAG: PorT family protein [Paludibacteraceae bacterium]|nr:PorT family protein [Prevotella sp.]MBQ8153921.1 PorT family protein [Prevotella sp.]MBQ8705790.1 PorT family protein [Paludibacteraceae bacterium]MBQ8715618.1 PorT family protein [Prevotella sp.]
MKRRLLFYLFVFLPFIAKAQVGEYRTDFAVGVNGGYILSKVGFTPDVPQSMLGGMTAGVTFRYTCEKYFKSICAIVAEVNIAQVGWKEKIQGMDNQPLYYEGSDVALHYERKMTYLQIPILARLGWGRERKGLQGFFQVGPQIGIFLGESTNTNLVDGQSPTEERSSNIVKQESMPVEKKFEYGITGGAGIEFSVPKVGHFLLEGRYYYGLGNIYGNTKSDYFGKSNFGQIVIKATYLFDLIKTKNDKIK